MIIRIIAFLLCGTFLPCTGKAHAETDRDAEMDADKVEENCEKVIRGEMGYNELLKLIPRIIHYATGYNAASSDRMRVRDCLKKVLFQVKLERTAYSTLQNAILKISESI